MYVSTRGLSGYMRAGMGGCNVATGADGQPKVVCDTPINVDTVLPSGTNVIQDASGNVILTSASSSLIPGIPNYALGIAAGAFGFVLLLKAMR